MAFATSWGNSERSGCKVLSARHWPVTCHCPVLSRPRRLGSSALAVRYNAERDKPLRYQQDGGPHLSTRHSAHSSGPTTLDTWSTYMPNVAGVPALVTSLYYLGARQAVFNTRIRFLHIKHHVHLLCPSAEQGQRKPGDSLDEPPTPLPARLTIETTTRLRQCEPFRG